jgi:hypothetical protein
MAPKIRTAKVAAVTDEAGEFFLMICEDGQDSDRWRISASLARKLRRELNERLD